MQRVILGVTGSIASYKALEVLRGLKKAGKDVVCILTENATKFVAPLSFSTLSDNKAITDFFEPVEKPIHIELAKSDLILIAPATYNFIGKVANGIADDALSCTIAAATCPVLFAPSMNTKMWENPLLLQNIEKLKSVGYYFIEPETGELASRDGFGKGRFPHPDYIVEEVLSILNLSSGLRGKKVIVTAGRTEAYIDPVRCLSNKSSGKMGYELAKKAREFGADVTLISGPSSLPPPPVRFVNVRTYDELKKEILKHIDSQAHLGADILIMAAAVCDYLPIKYSAKKIKSARMNLEFKRSEDILKLVRAKKQARLGKNLFIVGFALESENHLANAKAKLKDKVVDLMIANDVSSLSADTTKLILIDNKLKSKKLPLLPKSEAATKVMEWLISEYLKSRKS